MVAADHSGWCVGDNSQGQIGNGSTADEIYYVKVAGSWATLDAGSDDTTCGIRTDGTGWCWGDNSHGQLGSGTTTGSTVPVQVSSQQP